MSEENCAEELNKRVENFIKFLAIKADKDKKAFELYVALNHLVKQLAEKEKEIEKYKKESEEYWEGICKEYDKEIEDLKGKIDADDIIKNNYLGTIEKYKNENKI